MSEGLRNSSGAIGTVSDISKHGNEIESFIKGVSPIEILSSDKDIENPSEFVLEMHLEDFLIKNWERTPLSKNYDIYKDEDEEVSGKQFPTDTGPIDILAISKDKKEYLVIELKKGRASDNVVGQVQRYMGFIKDEYLEKTTNSLQFVYDNVYDMLNCIRLEEKKVAVVQLIIKTVDLKSVPFLECQFESGRGH